MSEFFRQLRGSQDALPPLQNTGELVIPEEFGKGFARVNVVRHRVAHLSEVARVLRPGGRFVVATTNRLNYSRTVCTTPSTSGSTRRASSRLS